MGTVFLAVAPACVATYFFARHTGTEGDLRWMAMSAGVGLVALAAAWFGGEHFVLRQIRVLYRSARLLASGDLSSRTGLAGEPTEIGQLGRTFDEMAAGLQARIKEREKAEKDLLVRALQQTVVSALGQLALVNKDFPELLKHAALMVGQTLEVEYCGIFELDAATRTLLLRAGTGWKPEAFGSARLSADPDTQAGYTLQSGEPVVLEQTETNSRFRASPLLQDHGVVSSVNVSVSASGESFGVIGAYTTRPRKFNGDEVQFLLSVGTVLAMAVARRATEAQIEKLATFARLNPNPAMELKADGTISYSNEAALQLARALGKNSPQEVLPSNIQALVHTCLDGGPSKIDLETQFDNRSLSWSFHAMPSSKVVHAYVEDITDRLNMQAQLRQSQKMESIGQLAAGVAHDFNNMLTIIQGHSGLLMARASDRPELQDSAQAVYFASERAANLTRQLLMFSRKNVMQPRDVDLRELVTNLMKMLQRLLGETITLSFKAPEHLALINADPGMLEQVIMNLAVNARDAMPKGGTLSLSVSFVEVEQPFLASHPEARTGPFVCLKVTDNGCGMDAATQARIFEPFFTTKEVGKGTGLGLATVYGIVKQHQGWIQVHSSPGQGSSFSVFFPAQQTMATAPGPELQEEQPVPGGSETILVVEDEPVVREMAQIILAEAGYNVLEAGNGREALRLWRQHGPTIDLVLTDVVMPEGISGVQLAEQLLAVKPGLRLIFASGYSMDDLDPRFVQEGHAAYLQKPYTHVTLTRAVRESLDRKPATAPGGDAASAPNI